MQIGSHFRQIGSGAYGGGRLMGAVPYCFINVDSRPCQIFLKTKSRFVVFLKCCLLKAYVQKLSIQTRSRGMAVPLGAVIEPEGLVDRL
jgi:hypothetical protein